MLDAAAVVALSFAVVAVCVALERFVLKPKGACGAGGGHAPLPAPAPVGAAELRKHAARKKCGVCQARAVWLDHVFWTREVVLLTTQRAPEAAAAPSVARLLRNNTDVAEWFQRQLEPSGAHVVAALKPLLDQHKALERKLVIALRDGAPAAEVAGLQQAWYANGCQNADAQFALSERHRLGWSCAMLRHMWREHLDLSAAVAQDLLRGDFARSVVDADRALASAVDMADYFSAPFKGACCKAL